jgi:trans-aconitate 2-methyltransferase
MTAKKWDAELYEARHGFVWRLGEGVVDFLNPQPGERILDLGCGTGQLTQKIADSGANVLGLDASPDMIGQARQNYPNLQFVLANAAALQFENEFDAVFSNAALHWMLDRAGVIAGVARALKRGGRFVAELGGNGNVRELESAIETVAAKYHTGPIPERRTYYPALGEYAALLEAHGLEVTFAQLFDRPTPLEGEDGMANWVRQFKWYYFEALRAGQQEEALRDVIEELRPTLRNSDGWYADYRRLRVSAVKT